MPLLRKMAGKIWNTVGETFDSIGDSFTGFLTKKYPDIDEVFDTLREMRTYYDTTDGDGVDGDKEVDKGDDKWRPMLLTLGLLYKLQRIQDSSPNSWYNKEEIFVRDDAEEERLLRSFGFYWHYCMKIAEALRSIDNKGTGHNMDDDGNLVANEDTFNNVIASTGLTREDVVFAHATDSLHVDEHCPDFSVVLLHELQQILIVICGTRMIPSPKMRDVFMDLYAESIPFLRGEGHQGMVIGAKNIMTKTINKIAKTLVAHPGYNIMVIGYSLGAGICQLVTMDLLEGEFKSRLPEGTVVRCVSFGSPPIFKSSEHSYKCPNIFSVVYNNDGLSSASVASVTKLFMQIRAVDRLRMRRRDMAKLLCKKIPTLDGGELNEDGDDDDDDDFEEKHGSTKDTAVLQEHGQWLAIRQAVEAVNAGSVGRGIKALEHPARQLYIFKRREANVITRRLHVTTPLSDRLRLRGAMFSNHMPWGYNALFEGFGNDVSEVDLSVLDVSSQQQEQQEEQLQQQQQSGNSLYPDLHGL